MCISQIEPNLLNQFFYSFNCFITIEIQEGSDKFTAGFVADFAASLKIQ
jgi:hypothetical protein